MVAGVAGLAGAPGPARARAAIVVPVYNAQSWLPVVLPALELAAHRAGSTITAVDNGSTDGSFEYLLERAGPLLTVVRRPELGISALRNHGAACAQSELLAFVDADCLVGADYLEQAARVLDSTGAAATGSPYDLPADPHWIELSWWLLHRHSQDGWVNYLPAGNFIVRRSAFEAVGGFDERLVTGEDAELCQRLIHAGYRILSSSDVSARHLGNPKTIGQFFRKQYWHALGMLGTFRRNRFDKPLLLTVLHLLCLACAIILLAGRGWAALGWTLLLAEAAPLLAVAFRWVQQRRVIRPLRSVLLYTLYLWARLFALPALFGSPSKSRGRK